MSAFDPKQALRLRDAQATAYRQSWRSSSTPLVPRVSQNHLKKLASMLHREHVCIEIGDPLLALLRDSKVAQGVSDIRPDRLPEEIWIVSSQICDAIVACCSFPSRKTRKIGQLAFAGS